jgi:hypothetical protein
VARACCPPSRRRPPSPAAKKRGRVCCRHAREQMQQLNSAVLLVILCCCFLRVCASAVLRQGSCCGNRLERHPPWQSEPSQAALHWGWARLQSRGGARWAPWRAPRLHSSGVQQASVGRQRTMHACGASGGSRGGDRSGAACMSVRPGLSTCSWELTGDAQLESCLTRGRARVGMGKHGVAVAPNV